MDVDTESIIKLISPSLVHDAWKDNPDFYSYLTKLGNYSVEQLNKEPDHLNAEKVAILNQKQELAFANYKTFIQTAECSRQIFQQFNKTEERLDSLLKELPEFSRRCEEFGRCCEEIRGRRRMNTICLTRHGSVLQALEVPQLMETVIREGRYDEALQLASYVRRLTRTHPNIPLIKSISNEVEKWWWVLMQKLVSGLRCEVELPRCLQLVGHLRRMDVLSEAELRLKFLQARGAWFNSVLASVPTQDASLHLSKTIELSRTHLFNIITQYKAVFADSEVGGHSVRPRFSEVPLLQAWINEKVNEIVSAVEADVARGVGPNLASLLGQCMYFGQSLSRVGADMRASLAPVFIRLVHSSLTTSLTSASQSFTHDMEKFTLQPSVHPLLLTSNLPPQPAQALAPPNSLLEFYPLSNCCNSIVSALNDLRLCAPLCLAQHTTQLLTQLLVHVSNNILLFYRREQQAMSSEEREVLTRLCCCFSEQLVPYVQACLQQVYSPMDIATYLGVSTSTLQTEGLTYLEVDQILAPISHLLPPKLEPLTGYLKPSPIIDTSADIEKVKDEQPISQMEKTLREEQPSQDITQETAQVVE